MDSSYCNSVVNLSLPFRSRFAFNRLLPFCFVTVLHRYHFVSLPFCCRFVTVLLSCRFLSHTVEIGTERGRLYRRTIVQRRRNVNFLLTPTVGRCASVFVIKNMKLPGLQRLSLV